MMGGSTGREGNGSGSWSETEQSQFEKGVIAHGWGNWRHFEEFIPTRSNVQIKSHAQKFRKHRSFEWEVLRKEHEARKQRYANVGAEGTRKSAAKKAAVVAGTPNRKKAVARRNGSSSFRSGIKVKLPAPPLRSPRPLRPGSAPPGGVVLFGGAVAANSLGGFRTPVKKTPPKKLPAGRSPALGLTEVTSGVCRATLHERVTSTTSCPGLVSPRRPPALERHHQDDELAALAAAVTPSPATHNMNIDELIFDNDSFADAPSPAKAKVEDADEISDPLLHLEVDDDNLDMNADFLDPSWNMVLPPAAAPQEDVFLFPVSLVASRKKNVTAPYTGSFVRHDSAPPALCTTSFLSHDSIPPVPAMGEAAVSEIGDPFELLHSKVRPDPQLFLNIQSQLTSPPDFNSPKEYVLGEDGCSRMGVEDGALCRARIKGLLEEHSNMGWWKDAVSPNSPSTPGQELSGKFCFKKFALERLIALSSVMLYDEHWHTPQNDQATPIAIGAPTATEGQRFNDEDDIRHVGQLLSGLWERVNRSLDRDGFTLLGTGVGSNSSSMITMERCAAINQMVTRLDMISRKEGNIKFSPHDDVSMNAYV